MADEPTTSEVFRMVQQMREDWKEGNRTVTELLTKLDEKTDRIEEQTTKTNGRVNGLEKSVYGGDGNDGLNKTVTGLSGRERYVAGALAVIFALFGVVPFVVNLYLHDVISKELKEYTATQKAQAAEALKIINTSNK